MSSLSSWKPPFTERAPHSRSLLGKMPNVSGVQILQATQEYGKDIIFYSYEPDQLFEHVQVRHEKGTALQRGPQRSSLREILGLVPDSVLYLTTTGRTTGLPRQIEIWFVESDGKLYILAEHFHKAHWVQNIERDARVRIRLGKREFGAIGRVLDQKRDAEAWQLVQKLAREKYGWGEGLPVEFTPNDP